MVAGMFPTDLRIRERPEFAVDPVDADPLDHRGRVQRETEQNHPGQTDA